VTLQSEQGFLFFGCEDTFVRAFQVETFMARFLHMRILAGADGSGTDGSDHDRHVWVHPFIDQGGKSLMCFKGVVRGAT
jgi:hypothetical protein